MSCYPKCPVPNFLLPKKLRDDQQTTDCVERCYGPKCTGYKLYAIQPQTERCINAELAELMRCQACQEQRLRRLTNTRLINHECYLQKLTCKYPEIPLLGRPEHPLPTFIKHGYVEQDCFPESVLQNPCQQRADWRNKKKAWIKALSDHYNQKVADSTEKPIEDYIRLNMAHQCLACRGYQVEKPPETDGKCGDKVPTRPRCMMVGINCGKCTTFKEENKKKDDKLARCLNLGETRLPHACCKLR